MLLLIRVKPGSKSPGIEEGPENTWIVRVREHPIEGKANKAVLRLLAETLDVAPSRLHLQSGESARTKRIVIPDLPDWRERLKGSR